MDREKIEQLKERRLLLQEEVRLKTLRQRIAIQLNYLDQHNYPYKVYYNHEHLNWIRSNVRVRKRDGYNGIYGDFQIDVDDEIQKDAVFYCTENLLSEKFAEQFLSLVQKDSSLVVCYEGGDPEIEISIEAFLSQPFKFIYRIENWAITKDEKWIIEYICDQEVIRFIQLQNGNPVLIKKIIIQGE